MNEFCLFRAFFRCHFLYDFHTWGVTFKGKAMATKCIFQNYSQLLDICTWLVLKTAEELILPSVHNQSGGIWMCIIFTYWSFIGPFGFCKWILIGACIVLTLVSVLMIQYRHVCFVFTRFTFIQRWGQHQLKRIHGDYWVFTLLWMLII